MLLYKAFWFVLDIAGAATMRVMRTGSVEKMSSLGDGVRGRSLRFAVTFAARPLQVPGDQPLGRCLLGGSCPCPLSCLQYPGPFALHSSSHRLSPEEACHRHFRMAGFQGLVPGTISYIYFYHLFVDFSGPHIPQLVELLGLHRSSSLQDYAEEPQPGSGPGI